MRKNTKLMLMSLLLASGMTAAGSMAQVSAATIPLASAAKQDSMVGKQVLGKSRELLGTVVSVDNQKGTVAMKAPGGATVPVPTDKLTVEEDHLRAPTMSRGDVIALIRATGQSGIFEVNDTTKVVR